MHSYCPAQYLRRAPDSGERTTERNMAPSQARSLGWMLATDINMLFACVSPRPSHANQLRERERERERENASGDGKRKKERTRNFFQTRHSPAGAAGATTRNKARRILPLLPHNDKFVGAVSLGSAGRLRRCCEINGSGQSRTRPCRCRLARMIPSRKQRDMERH